MKTNDIITFKFKDFDTLYKVLDDSVLPIKITANIKIWADALFLLNLKPLTIENWNFHAGGVLTKKGCFTVKESSKVIPKELIDIFLYTPSYNPF